MLQFTRRSFAALLAGTAVLLAGCATTPAQVQRVVVLGDSNVDTGNLYRLSGEKIPGPPNWKGRNSNGPNVAEYLAEKLGAKLESHAVSGATTGEGNIVPLVVPGYSHLEKTGVAAQVDALAASGARFGPQDLIIVWAGSNDIFGAKRSDRADLDRRISSAAANVERTIDRMRAMGAQRFVVANRTPREVLGSENDLNGQDLNKAIAEAVTRAKARTGADIRLFDAYGVIARMMANPQEYGFKDSRGLCMSVPACAQDSAVGATYVNWDGAHKTTRVHQILADQLVRLLANS